MRGYRAIALTISTSIFMQFHDATALNTAVPTIARDLQVPVLHMDIAILAYQIMLVVFVPMAAVVAGRLGARNAFASALFVFMCGSILCALAETLTMLAVARALQGIGGAMMMPLGRLIVVRSAEKSELISAMNWLVIPGIVGPVMGPAVGGLIVQYSSWHWIFLINVPIALIGIVMTLMIVPDRRDEHIDPFDRTGVLLLSPLVIAAVLGLGGLTGRLPAGVTLVLLVAAVALALAYYRHARRTDTPILDLSLLAVPSFRHSMVSGTLIRLAFMALGFLMPLWLQLAMHMSAAQTGGLMMMTSLGALASRFISVPLLRIVHPRTLAVYGAGAMVIMLLIGAGLRPSWPLPLIYLLLACQGLAMSMAMLVLVPASYVDVSAERMAAATSFYSMVQQLTMSLGVVLGVWSLTAMRWLVDATPDDNGAYSGSMIVLAFIGGVAMLVSRKLSSETMGALSPRRG